MLIVVAMAGSEPHRDEQEKKRITAVQLWQDSGYVFTTPRGEPVNPNTYHGHWKRRLADNPH